MIFKVFNSDRSINVSLTKYLIKWDKKVSIPQFTFKQFVYPFWRNDVVLEEFVIPKSGGKRIDLFNITKGLVVEVSPVATHFEYNKFLHGSRQGYRNKIKSDVEKIQWAQSNNFAVLEVVDEDLKPENLNRKYYLEKYGINL